MPVDPSTISGLVGWWKADAITGLVDTDPVATWPDSSGNGNNATQATSGREPLYRTNIVNGKPAVQFDGAKGMGTALSVSTPFTLFVAYQRTTSPGFYARVLVGTSQFLGARNLTTENDLIFTDTAVTGGTHAEDEWFVETGIRRASPSPETRLFKAFTQVASGSSTSNFGTVRFGRDVWPNDDDRLVGFMAEALVYNAALSDTDRESVVEYLHDKYAITPLLAGRSGRVYQAWGEIPGTERAARIYQAWGTLPDPARAGRVYQVWGEIPDFNRVGRIFQAWGTLPSLQSGFTGGAPGGAGDVVADFERLLPTVYATAFERPRGKSSWSNTGVGQLRASISAGMTWEETFQPARKTDPVLHAFLEYLNDLSQNERIFEIPLSGITSRPTLLGTATGSITVSGADQTGYSLAIAGLSGTLKRGDLIRVAGLNYVMAVQADATASPLTINPGILPGGSPASGAVVTYGSSLKIRAKIDQLFQPEVDANQVYIGLRVRFREVP